MDGPQVFVQIAAYRDPELVPTVERLLSTAVNPASFFSFGICWQHGPEEANRLGAFDGKPNFRVLKVPYDESRGLGWARSVTNGLHGGEPFTLQLDSHHMFADGWDAMLLEDYAQARTLSPKPVVTTYVPPYTVGEPLPVSAPSLMSQYEFSPDRLLMSRPWYIPADVIASKRVIRARTISAHFLFASSAFLAEVPYDPEAFFGGYVEEATLSSRAWTHGWDFFSPYRCYLFHEYTRQGRPKIWEDNPAETPRWDQNARVRTRRLHGQQEEDDEVCASFGRYGLGSARTLHEYEEFAGFDFKRCRLQRYTLEVGEPPNPKPWEAGFTTRTYRVTAAWDAGMVREDCEAHEDQKLVCLTLGFETRSGRTLHRADMCPATDADVFSFARASKEATFQTGEGEDERPARWVLWPLFEDGEKNKTWGRRQEGPVSICGV